MKFHNNDKPDGLRTAKREIVLLPGTEAPPHYKVVVRTGDRFHVENRVNKRGSGKGLVPVTNFWNELIGYLTVDDAKRVREEHSNG